MRLLTAGDIAKRIQRPHETVATAVYRLQNWTKEGFVQAVGQWQTGTGKPRAYRESALLDAVLLQTLVDCTGAAAVDAASILAKSQKHIVRMMEDGSLPGSVLVISRSRGAEPKISAGRAGQITKLIVAAGPHDTHTVITMKLLFDRIKVED